MYVWIVVCVSYKEVSVFQCQLCCSSVAGLLQIHSLTSKASHSEFLFSFSNILRFSPPHPRPPALPLSLFLFLSLFLSLSTSFFK